MESTDTTPIYSANFDLFYTLAQLGDGEYEEKRKLVEGYIQKWTDFNRIVASEFEPGTFVFLPLSTETMTLDI